MAANITKKAILSATAAAVVLGLSAPAFAGGRYHHHSRHHHHGYHHGGGGKGAAVALGIIGGAIILNEIAEDRARDRYYEDRYYRDTYNRRAYRDGYEAGRADGSRYDDRGYYDDRYDGGADYGDDASYEGEAYDDELAGGPEGPDRGQLRPISARAAYQTCLNHARQALGERGFVISAPYQPDTVENRGGALLMTATVTAQRGPDRWSRAMSCEANEGRVYRLELI